MSNSTESTTTNQAATEFQPRIVAFFCNWCTYTAADLTGVTRASYAPNVRVIRVMCSGRIDPQFVVAAMREGADGVLIGGCHPGDCHYIEGNYKALRRFKMLKRVLQSMGIEDKRVRLEWIAASEGEKVQRVINEMTAEIKELGPLHLAPMPKPNGEAHADDTESGEPAMAVGANKEESS